MEVKKNKYYDWRDLQKDPKDLPSENKIVNIVWVNHNPVSYYESIKDKPFLASALYYDGKWWWWSVVAEDLLAEYGKSPADEMDDAIEVIAWKYIEPFKAAEE